MVIISKYERYESSDYSYLYGGRFVASDYNHP